MNRNHTLRKYPAAIPAATLLLAALAFDARADAVTDWSDRSADIVVEAKLGTPPAIRVLALVQTAVHDAVQAVDRRHTGAGTGQAPSIDAAVAAASYVDYILHPDYGVNNFYDADNNESVESAANHKIKILEKLKDDEHYYGEFGKNFLSNSNISALLTNPLLLNEPQPPNPNFVIGGYFHTAILEPDKLDKYKIIKATTRNTNVYKELSGGGICLLQHEADKIELMKDTMLANNICKDLIRGFNVEYEKPGIAELFNVMWKGKADIINGRG